MVLLNNCNLGKNIMFTGFLKYFTFTFLIWTYHTYNDLVLSLYMRIVLYNFMNMQSFPIVHTYQYYYIAIYFYFIQGKFPKSLEIKYEHDKMLNAIFNRLLARHELETQSKRISLYGNSLEYKNNQKIKNIKECASIYGRMQENNLNNLKNNKRAYIHKNSKTKGISKLDGYCEQFIFNKIDKINPLAKNMYNIRNYTKKVLHKKYRLRFILLCLFPFIGIMIMAISIGYSIDNKVQICTSLCKKNVREVGAIPAIAFLMMSSYIFLLLIIYFIRKYIKYEKTKAGKGKISIKVYFRWLKDIL